MTTPWPVEWFTVQSGPQEGRRRISGWLHTSIDGRPIGVCPVCVAMVPAGDGHRGDNAATDLTGWHERWHAANDFPDPGSG
jgi:hypothetical protein